MKLSPVNVGMSESQSPRRLPKTPFYIADVVLSGVAVYVLYRLGKFEGAWELGIVAICLLAAAFAAWLSITPWLTEYRTSAKVAETTNLNESLRQIERVEDVGTAIQQANSQWQGVQDAANRTVLAAKEIADRMKTETEDFMQFLNNARNQERAHMQLEIDKLRKAEGDWLKVTVQMLDHVFALHGAAVRSAESKVVAQLEQFQNACREAARRIGLTPYIPKIGEDFDTRGHQLPDTDFQAPAGSKVGQVLATGFTYQGQLLRRALVLLANVEPAPSQRLSEPAPSQATAEPAPAQPAEEVAPEPPKEKGPEQLRLV